MGGLSNMNRSRWTGVVIVAAFVLAFLVTVIATTGLFGLLQLLIIFGMIALVIAVFLVLGWAICLALGYVELPIRKKG